MRRVRVGWIMLGCLAAFAPAHAVGQGYYDQEAGFVGPLVWNFGGTLAVPLGDSEDRVDVGGGFAVGVTYNANPALGVQFEYGADWASLKTSPRLGADISGNALLQYFNLNAFVRPVRAGRIGMYLVGGGGLYYRRAEVTRFEGTVPAAYCDPWLYFCSTTAVPVSSVLASRSTWDWGLDAGLGFTFAVAPLVRLYIEARYHYIFGPSFTDANGTERSADGQYLPLTLGVRF
jgi:opacity protein-like surface antigen